MVQDNNDELWTGDFPMWKKRVLLTQWAGQVWDEMYLTFDFSAVVHKIETLMTVDGINDDLICIEGAEKYTFTDADAHDLTVNERSDEDVEEEEEEEEEEEDQEVEDEDEEEQGRAGGSGSLDDSDNDTQEGEEVPTHTFDDDLEDDTTDSQQVLWFVSAQ